MQLSQALEEVSKIYINGTIEFYNGMKPDPWEAAHERYEGQLLLYGGTKDYFDKMAIAAQAFYEECKKLIEKFKVFNDSDKQMTFIDAFAIGNIDRVSVLQSIELNECAKCGVRENVFAGTDEKLGPGIYCIRCLK
jgi:hypothetical protein